MSSWRDEERPTRKQRREDARAQRKAREAEEHARAVRRKRLAQGGGVLGALAVLAVAAIIATGSGGGSGVTGSGASAGLQATPAPWAPEGRALSARVQALNLPFASEVGYHVHAVVRVYVNGQQIPVPGEIGVEGGLRGTRLESLHTHDTRGIIHIESSEQYPFTLGQFMTVWGVKFTSTQLGSYLAGNGDVLSVYANGKPAPDPTRYVMNSHDDIVVGYGKPRSFPTSFQYNWAAVGL